LILTAALSALAVASPAFAAGSRPAASTIRAAVRNAERSRNLWATINICNTKNHPDVIGIRGQMPSLSFSSSLYMEVQAEYWSPSAHRLMPVPRAVKVLELSSGHARFHQGGVDFRFEQHAGLLSGEITFEWKLAGRIVGEATRQAARGHASADFGDPAHFSASECVIA
jgi:hypothetical protein